MKQAGVTILISDKINLKTKLVRRDREEHYNTHIQKKIYQEDIATLSVYAPNISTQGH